MKNYKKVEVSEAQFEDLIRQAPHLIEEGLRYVDHQRKAGRDPLDVLMVDSGGALIVAELKVREDDGMLVQGIDYYDWITRNIEGLSRAYKSFDINPTQTPRLLLIAPSVSVKLLNRCKWIDIPISIFTYNCLKFEDSDELTPVFTEMTIPSSPIIIETHSLEDNLRYITDTTSNELAKDIIEEIKTWDGNKIIIEPLKCDVSMKFSGRVFAYLYPRRNFFHIYTYDKDGVWSGYKINDYQDFEDIKELMKAYIRGL